MLWPTILWGIDVGHTDAPMAHFVKAWIPKRHTEQLARSLQVFFDPVKMEKKNKKQAIRTFPI